MQTVQKKNRMAIRAGIVVAINKQAVTIIFFNFKTFIMKLRTFIAVAAITILAACGTPYRATDTVVNVPAGTRTAFTTQYPGATNVIWTTYDAQVALPIDWELAGWITLDANDYTVRFDMDNEKYYAWYDSDGTWIGTAYVMSDYKTMPAVVNTTLTTQFPGYSITSVNREFQKDRMAYEVQLINGSNKAKVLIDSNGNIIKQKTKMQ
jgi:uncharacterized membrane protein YkoI